MAATRVALASGWQVKQSDHDASDDTAWIPVRSVPTVVHLDLLDESTPTKYRIPHPLQDLNELDVRWVGETSWTYRCSFSHGTTAELSSRGTTTDLVFKGLDTFATVRLNGREILRTDNMFIEYRVDVSSLLLVAGENELLIDFAPARQRGLDLVRDHPEHRFIAHQTDISRVPVRKAQYHWGWDWGPILLTCGPWKPVLLERYVSRIDDVAVSYTLDDELTTALASCAVTAKAGDLVPEFLELEVWHGQTLVARDEITSRDTGDGPWTAKFELKHPEMWWPHGYGQQSLYEVKVRILAGDRTLLDETAKRVGFRRAELVQDKDELGQSFYFRVNNVDIFTGGSCWVPADTFLPSVDRAGGSGRDYRAWVELMVEGNQVMTRVWGGGIYESDTFYDACDELGVLVWQDFAFACASVPTYPEFLQSVETEARQNVRRLRHHPALVIWAGNNEDYQLVERYGLQYDFEGDKDPQSWLKTDFPARYLYEHLFPKIVREESASSVAYHPSSPWGNGTSTTLKVDPTVGDIHQWNVWHGDMRPYQELPELGGRFVSEFGMEAYPHLSTLLGVVTDPAQRYPGSEVVDFHNKAVGHEQRMLKYVGENFRIRYDLAAFTHLTQVMQADAVAAAYRGWRRRWGRQGARACGGVLVWQLNDCWPTISWAVVDSLAVPKPAFYAIKRALELVAVGVVRKFHPWTFRPADRLWQRDTGHINPREATEVEFDVWVASSRQVNLRAVVLVRYVSVRSGETVLPPESLEVDVLPNGTTDVIARSSFHSPEPCVISVELLVNDEKVSGDISWPDPIKYLDFSDRGVRVTDEGHRILVSAEKPVKGFVFSEKPGIRLSGNGFDIVPPEVKVVSVQRLGSEAAAPISWTYVGQE